MQKGLQEKLKARREGKLKYNATTRHDKAKRLGKGGGGIAFIESRNQCERTEGKERHNTEERDRVPWRFERASEIRFKEVL